MKIVTMSRIKNSKIYNYIEKDHEYTDGHWTFNLPEAMLKFIAQQSPDSRTQWLKDAINEYINYLENHGFGKLFNSRSEFIKHAVIEKKISILDKTKHKLTSRKIHNELERIHQEVKLKKLIDPNNIKPKKPINKPWIYTKPKKLLRVFPKQINWDLIVSHLNELKEDNSLSAKEIAVLIGFNSNNGYANTLVRKINEKVPNLIIAKKKGVGKGRIPLTYSLNKEVLAECL